jgi:catechol 2,3-dioxygenase-like lactoylglutathione lyase family enzyme
MLTAALGAPVQIAYAVPDADAAAHRWASELGAGPFFLRRHIAVSDVVYRGQPSVFDHTSAYGQWGPVMVELVQDHGTAASVVRERFAPHESGLHHLAFIVADLDRATAHVESLGFALAMTARSSTTRFHFLDAVPTLGHMIELYERSDRLAAFYAMVLEASIGWDGTDPVRPLA